MRPALGSGWILRYMCMGCTHLPLILPHPQPLCSAISEINNRRLQGERPSYVPLQVIGDRPIKPVFPLYLLSVVQIIVPVRIMDLILNGIREQQTRRLPSGMDMVGGEAQATL